MIVTRPAREDDAPQLVILLKHMGYETNPEQVRSRIAAFDGKNSFLLIAEMDGVVCGVIAFGMYEQFRVAGGCCHIDTLIVHENYQGKGVGRRLVELAEKHANEHGASVVELIMANYRQETGTHQFYKSLGFKDHQEWDLSYFAKGHEIGIIIPS